MAAQDETPPIAKAIRPRLSPAAYRSGTAGAFLLWGGLLFLFFYSRVFEVWVKREDLIGLAQTVAGLAAVALAILTIVQETGNRDRFLKLLLAGLTFVLLLATLAGWISVFTIQPLEKDAGIKLLLRVAIVGGVYITLGISGILIAVTGKRRSLTIHVAYDYSPFVAPFFAFLLWSPRFSLAGTSVALSIGGMAYLTISTIVLLLSLWRVRTHQEELEPQVMEILQAARERHRSAGNRYPVSLEYLRNRLGSNDETLLEVLDQLCRDDRVIRVDYRTYYILYEEDRSKCQDIVLSFDVVVLPASTDNTLWKEISYDLGERLHVPDSVVTRYLAERVRELVVREFKQIGVAGYKGEFCLYFRERGKPWPDLGPWKWDRKGAGKVVLNNYACLPSKGESGNNTLEEIIGWAAL